MATKALSHTGGLQHNGTFICYAWPQRPSATRVDYSITTLSFFMRGQKGPQPQRLITAFDTFICYEWPQRPSATQAGYSITALLLAVLGYISFITT